MRKNIQLIEKTTSRLLVLLFVFTLLGSIALFVELIRTGEVKPQLIAMPIASIAVGVIVVANRKQRNRKSTDMNDQSENR